MKKKKKEKSNNLILKVLIACLGLACGIITIVYMVTPFYTISSRTKKIDNAVKDGYPAVAWIRVQGTNIDYPVLYSMDDNYPIENADIDFAWSNSDSEKIRTRTIVYGHNIRNVSKHPLVNEKTFNDFENLPSFLYYAFVKDNKYIQYTIGGKDYIYKIYGVSMISEKLFSYVEDMTEKEKKEYIKDTKEVSYFNFDIDVDSKDQLITLITCTRFFGDTQTLIKIDGRLLREDEKMNNYGVEKNKNYTEIEETMKGEEENVQEEA